MIRIVEAIFMICYQIVTKNTQQKMTITDMFLQQNINAN